MMNRRTLFLAMGLASVGLIAACSSGGGSSGSNNDNIETEEVISSEAVNLVSVKENYVAMAAAVYGDSHTTAVELQSAVASFVATPTEETLESARAAYKAARKPYQQSEIYRFDTVTLIGGSDDLSADGGLSSVDDWEGQVNAWPLDETRIEYIIDNPATNSPINPQLLVGANGQLPNGTEDEANVTTGVHAIEFMLWDRDDSARGPGPRTAAEFGSNADCVSTPATVECRNSEYLQAAADLLVEDLTAMKAEWVVDTTDNDVTLAENFLSFDEEAFGYILQSIANMSVGELGGARLSAGLWRPADTQPTDILKTGDYEEEHDCFSDLSHVAVYYNFQGVLNAFEGTYESMDGTIVGDTDQSFGAYVASLDEQSYNELRDKFAEIQTNMDIVFAAGEADKSFDEIIADSESAYETPGDNVRSTELVALESAIQGLGEVEEITKVIAEASAITGFDSSETGETD
jgi:putative iron-regulated protein